MPKITVSIYGVFKALKIATFIDSASCQCVVIRVIYWMKGGYLFGNFSMKVTDSDQPSDMPND
jgi:hypothetical protein